jgi:hypothetical protein
MTKKTVYLLVTSENLYELKYLPNFIKFIHYDEVEKKAYPDDMGKMDFEKCTFRFCTYKNTIVYEKTERFFLEPPEDKDMVELSADEMFDSLMKLIPKK